MKEKLTETYQRAVAWMDQQSQADGSYRDALPVLAAYYKTPFFWAVSGRPDRFGRAVRYMEGAFHGPDGFCSEIDPEAPAYNSHFFNYMMGWVARGAWIGGTFGLAVKAYEYLAQPQGKSLQATCDEGPTVSSGTRNIGSAANAAVSFLYAGDMEHARQCETYVWSVVDGQNRKEVLYVRTDADGRILTEFAEDERAITVIDLNATDQMFWYFGIIMAMHAKLFECTGQKTYLERAELVFDVFDRCLPNVAGDDLTVGKVAYATATLYRLTGQQKCLRVCRKTCDNVIRSQHAEGYWLYGRGGNITELNRSTILDFCAEMAIWCIEITRELAAARAW